MTNRTSHSPRHNKFSAGENIFLVLIAATLACLFVAALH